MVNCTRCMSGVVAWSQVQCCSFTTPAGRLYSYLHADLYLAVVCVRLTEVDPALPLTISLCIHSQIIINKCKFCRVTTSFLRVGHSEFSSLVLVSNFYRSQRNILFLRRLIAFNGYYSYRSHSLAYFRKRKQPFGSVMCVPRPYYHLYLFTEFNLRNMISRTGNAVLSGFLSSWSG